jgi:hypothetical protein
MLSANSDDLWPRSQDFATMHFLVVLAIICGLSVLAFVAAAIASGVSTGFLSSGLIFVVVVGFLVAALFEIKRLVDQP